VPAGVTRPSIKVIAGPAAGRAVELSEGAFVIGRSELGDGSLGGDPELSRRHARVFERDGRLLVEDLGSSNGTLVNGRPVEGPTEIGPGDVIDLGSTRLEVVPPATPPSPAAGPPAGAPGSVLEVASGPAAGSRLPLGAEPLVVGRAEPGEGALGGDPELSRRHAQFATIGGRLTVEDLDSTNGTFVNGHRVAYPTVLQPGDAVELGTSSLRVAEAPAERPSRVSMAAVDAVRAVRAREGSLLGRLAALASRRPRRILAATGILFLISLPLGGPVPGLLPSAYDPDPEVESSEARDKLKEASGRAPGVGLVVLVRSDRPVTDSATRAKVEQAVSTLEDDSAVAELFHFYQRRDSALVSRDRRSTYIGVVLDDLGDEKTEEAAERLRDELEKESGVLVGGELLVGPTVGEQAGEDLGKAEAIAFPVLFLASFLVFRGLIAALLPLFVGILTIFFTFLTLRLVNEAITGISVYALNMVIALGLGLAIDYSLFVVSRYREELARSGPGAQAITRTLQTAGRTVIFSAVTVAAALASLLVFPQSFVYSMGIGGAVCALIAVAVSLIALPALLALLGDRVNAAAPRRWREASEREARHESRGFWYRVSRAVMRRPVPVALASAAILIALGLPFLGVKFTGVDASVLPKDSNVRKVDTALRTEFPSNLGRQVILALEAPAGARGQVEDYARELDALPEVAAVQPPSFLGDEVWEVDLIPRRPVLDDRTQDLVREIRDRDAPFPVSVTGPTADFIDQQASLGDHLPWAVAILAVVTAFILFMLTGSVVLPIKSLVMNLLTVSAALGLLVLIFQDGRLEGVLGYESSGTLDAVRPLLLFALAFGLSTDYAVFLLTRIKEARESGLPENEAVAVGLERTGRIVTAAALLFCIAIGAFATSELIFIKQLGIGTAFAVIVDATIVRALLVPSLMALLGRRNWWAPGPLRRLHARFGISEG
jgi:uncharacterized membrane protein YdfJ with MMPL/SSD domain/pSer/pThr/pTyr-binding forkhead associated (FHA) protein